MPDFSSGYQAPGVYVEDTSTPIVTTSGVPSTVVCLVGPAQGFETQTDSLSVRTNSATSLSNSGVFGPSDTAPDGAPSFLVTLEDGTALAKDTDYVLGKVGTGRAALTTIRRQGGDNSTTPATPASTLLTENATVIVSYAYADESYFTPRDFEDYDSIMAAYGLPMTQTPVSNAAESQVSSPLALASRIAFENGANMVIGVAIDATSGTLRDAYNRAYDATLADDRINVIVPLLPEPSGGDTHTYPVIQGFADDLANHCADAVREGNRRIGILGVHRSFGSVGGDFDDLARYINNKRIVLAYPNALNMFNGATNQSTVVDGYYLAAALSGILAVNAVDRSLTQQTVRSFSSLPAGVKAQMTTSHKNKLSKAGVLVVESDRSNQLTVRHGLTTAVGSIINRELSIVRCGDTLFELVQSGMKAAAMIGSPIGADTPVQVKGVLIGILENAVSNAVILNYTGVAVRQQTLPNGDPSVIECKFAYAPYVPLNYIVVSFSIDMSSGTTDLATQAA